MRPPRGHRWLQAATSARVLVSHLQPPVTQRVTQLHDTGTMQLAAPASAQLVIPRSTHTHRASQHAPQRSHPHEHAAARRFSKSSFLRPQPTTPSRHAAHNNTHCPWCARSPPHRVHATQAQRGPVGLYKPRARGAAAPVRWQCAAHARQARQPCSATPTSAAAHCVQCFVHQRPRAERDDRPGARVVQH